MSKLDKLNLTQDEVKRFHSAMDDPEFRRLLSEYAAEISDPRAREEQDAFLRMVEAKAKAGEADSLPGGMQIPKGHKLLSHGIASDIILVCSLSCMVWLRRPSH